mmetsp:Transcript_21204/g.32992  ORF Transcript_21204/g.32992 Transcript_21204/m.32992 type:complete len:189 (-) Transcript_21204:94-660(-)
MMAMPQLFLTSADPSLGKVDKSSLPQEILMDLLTQSVSNKERLYGGNEPRTNLSEWNYVKTNSAGEVVEIDWSFIHLRGSIDLRWVPLSTEQLAIQGNEFGGLIDFRVLPSALKNLDISNNDYAGSLFLEYLPAHLTYASMSMNEFIGEITLDKLPKSLQLLDISENCLSGSVNFTQLPETLSELYLH